MTKGLNNLEGKHCIKQYLILRESAKKSIADAFQQTGFSLGLLKACRISQLAKRVIFSSHNTIAFFKCVSVYALL